MRKLILIIMLIILATFTIPIIFTIRFEDGEKNVKETGETVKNIGNNELDEEKKENFAQNGASLMGENYEYKRYGTVKVLHTKDNSIEEMKMDEYLLGVVSAEMPADFEEEALKAQAVVARTYTVYKIEHNQSKHGEADICDNSACCQAWISKDDRMARWDEDKRESNWEKIEKAVSSTAGKVVTYNGEVIDAFFHSNSGGKTEEVSNVWGGSDLPYLQSVETSGEDAYSQYQSEAIFTKEEFEKKIKDKYPEFTIDYNDENCIKVIEYTQGSLSVMKRSPSSMGR
jgi:stage II sporulation protein D